MVDILAHNARDMGLIRALGAKSPVFITTMNCIDFMTRILYNRQAVTQCVFVGCFMQSQRDSGYIMVDMMYEMRGESLSIHFYLDL